MTKMNEELEMNGLSHDATSHQEGGRSSRQAQRELDQVLQTLVDGVVTVDLEGQIVYANQAAERILCVRKDEIVGRYYHMREWRQIDRRGDPYPLDQLPLAIVLRERRSVQGVEHGILAPNGDLKWLSVNAAPLFDQEGQLYGAVASFRDVTQKFQIEETLRQRLAMDAMVTTLSTRFINVSLDNAEREIDLALQSIAEFVEVDHCYVRWFIGALGQVTQGYKWHTLRVQPPLQALDDRAFSSFAWSRAILEAGQVLNVPCVADLPPQARAERELWQAHGIQSVLAVPLCLEQKLIGHLGFGAGSERQWNDTEISLLKLVGEILTNLFARQRAEAALRRSEERFRTVANFTYDWEYWVGPGGNLLYVSPSCERITGYKAAAFMADPGLLETLVLPKDRAAFATHLRDEFERESVLSIDFRIHTRDGETRWINHLCQSVYGEDGRWLGRRANNRDITERVRAERETQRRTAELGALREISLELTAQLDLDTLLRSVASHAVALLQGDAGGLCLYRPERDVLEVVTVLGEPAVPEGFTFGRGQGCSGHVWETGKPLLVSDYAQWADRVPELADAPVGAMVGAPIRWGGQFLGVLVIQSRTPFAFSQADVDLLCMLATQAAIAIRNAQLLQAEREQRALSAALESAAASVNSTLELEQVLDRILEQVERVVAGDAFNFMLVEGDEARVIRWRGYERFDAQAFIAAAAFSISEMPGLRHMLRSGEPFLVADTAHYPEWAVIPETAWICSFMSVPIGIGTRTVGFLNVDGARPGQFGPADLKQLEAFAHHAATAIENANLHQELQDYAQRLEQKVQARTAEIQAQYARLEAILRNVSDGIIVADTTGNVLRANPVARAWLHETLPPDDAAQLQGAVRELARRADAHPTMSLALARLDLELRASPISQPQGQETVVVDIHDVSRFKALNRMKTRFVTNVSHQLRTPVTNLKLYTRLLQSHSRPEKVEEYLQVLAGQIEMLERLVQDVLEVAALDGEQGTMDWRPVAVPMLVEDVVTRYTTQADSADVTLQAAPAVPDVVVQGDPTRLMRALGELVENALTFTPAGGQVSIDVAQVEQGGQHWVTIAVHDTGPGLSAQHQEDIFERFYRGRPADSGNVAGAGLGLSLAQEIMRVHGGKVTVQSVTSDSDTDAQGQGSTFTLWLPGGYGV